MMRLLTTALIFLLCACKSGNETLSFEGETMGTTYRVVVIVDTAETEPAVIETAIDTTLADVNQKLSNWDSTSEISKFNNAKSTQLIEISSELAEVIAIAFDVYEASERSFDVTLGPLIDLWGFGKRSPNSPIPTDKDIAESMEKVGQAKMIELRRDPNTLAKKHPEATVHLDAIAKGFGIDQLSKALQQLGIENYLVEIGGDLITSGKNPNGVDWRIGIEQPFGGDRAVEEVIEFTELGMATSGDYRNYFEEDGVRYSHIIDANTGRPIAHKTASVTVLADSAALADAWATALLVLGKERGMHISEKFHLAAFFISRQEGINELKFVTESTSRFKLLQANE
ncbi:MAG: FAD:protein FMN transferase [Pseudomonadota bacterium]